MLASRGFVPAGARAEDAAQLSITGGNRAGRRPEGQRPRGPGRRPASILRYGADRQAEEVEIRLFPLECNQKEQLKYPKAFYLVAPPPAECPRRVHPAHVFRRLAMEPAREGARRRHATDPSIAGSPLALDRAAIVSRAAPGGKVAVPISGDLRQSLAPARRQADEAARFRGRSGVGVGGRDPALRGRRGARGNWRSSRAGTRRRAVPMVA